MTTTTLIDTTNWVRIPFSAMGHDFNSALDPNGSMYPRVKALPAGVFEQMNQSCINELWAQHKQLSISELLDVVNLGFSQALVELVA